MMLVPAAIMLLLRLGTCYDFFEIVGELLARRVCHAGVSAVVVELLFNYGNGEAGLG